VRWCLAFLVACYQPARLDGDAALRKGDALPPDAPNAFDASPDAVSVTKCPTLGVFSVFDEGNMGELHKDWDFNDVLELTTDTWDPMSGSSLVITKMPATDSPVVAGPATFSFAMAPLNGSAAQGPQFSFVFGSDADDLTVISVETNNSGDPLFIVLGTSTQPDLVSMGFDDDDQHLITMSLSDPNANDVKLSYSGSGIASGDVPIEFTNGITAVAPELDVPASGGVVSYVSLCY
jgi:hypothetical protein